MPLALAIHRALVLEPLANEQTTQKVPSSAPPESRVRKPAKSQTTLGRDAALDERLFHFVRFVVVARVSPETIGFDFAGVPDLAGGVDAVAEIEVFAAGHARAGAKHQADLGARQV